ncbi:MAG TPA: hypothetical protein VFC10_15160 [Terriglobia bacterium]|nr:hypothetical protein [Terriglobia bacterium]
MGTLPAFSYAVPAVDRVRELLKEIGMPARLSVLEIRREMVPTLFAKVIENACHSFNPQPCAESDMAALYEKAL